MQMSEEETVSVEEGTLPGVAQTTESTEHNDVSQDVQEDQQNKRNDAEYNWAEMRRKLQEQDQKINDKDRQISELTNRPLTEEEDELANLAKDDIVTVAQAEKLADRRARKIAKELIQQQAASTVEERVNLKYHDYSEIVSKENIKFLQQTEPELAESLYHMPDPYKQAVGVYKLLKKITTKKEEPSLEKRKAMENSQKPLSVNAVTQQSAIGNAHLFENGLSQEKKDQFYKEMQEAIKRG